MLLLKEAMKSSPEKVEALEKIVTDGNMSYNDNTVAKFWSDFKSDGIESAIQEIRGMEDLGLFREGTYAKSIILWSDWKKELDKKAGYGIDEDEGPVDEPEYNCESCGWKGLEDELERSLYPLDGEYYSVCPECGSDEILEIPKQASRKIAGLGDELLECINCGYTGRISGFQNDSEDDEYYTCPKCKKDDVKPLTFDEDAGLSDVERSFGPDDETYANIKEAHY